MRIVTTIGISAVLLILLTMGFSCDSSINASLDQEFTLPINHTAIINGENLSIRFDKVTTDSRCPKGVVCVWAGEARCITYFSIKNVDTTPAAVELVDPGGRINGYSQATWTSNNVTYKINFRLDPYPEAEKTINSSDYKLIMLINKSN